MIHNRFLTTLLLLGACDRQLESRPLPELPPVLPASTVPVGEERSLRRVVIAWTAEVRGEIEACGCPTVPYGGLARRSRALTQLREAGGPVFVFDAGEMLMKGQDTRDAPQRASRARLLLHSVEEMGLDAWAPAPGDLLPGGMSLLAGSRAISSNWKGDYLRSMVVEREGVRLGVLGLGATGLGQEGDDPVAAVRQAMAGKEVDGWVLLSNASPSTTQKVAAEVPGLGIVLSGKGEKVDPPLATKGAPVVEAPDRGRYLSVVRAWLGSGTGPWTVVDEGVWARVATAERLLVGLTGEAAAQQKKVIAGLQAELLEASRGRNVAVVEERPLGSDLDGPSALDARVQAFQQEIQRLAQARATTVPASTGYGSASSCVSCHRDRFVAWSYDPHAKAYDALLERKATRDPECVGCHSTGYGEPGGFGTLTDKDLDRFKAVQCEACHGPRGSHPEGNRGMATINAQTCLHCHDPANSPQFDYEAYRRRISCSVMSSQK